MYSEQYFLEELNRFVKLAGTRDAYSTGESGQIPLDAARKGTVFVLVDTRK